MFDINDAPSCVLEFLQYMLTQKGRSQKTVYQYYHDLRTFARYLACAKEPKKYDINRPGDIIFSSVTDDMILGATQMDIRGFLTYVSYNKENKYAAMNRKISALRSFYKYHIATMHIKSNPTEHIESLNKARRLPKFLTLNESVDLLKAVSGNNYERDYAIVTLFLNCGLRVSELVGISLKDISFDQGTIRIIGKGNKERIIYLNDACISAINAYLAVRPDKVKPDAENALFISRNKNRISVQTVQWMIYKYLDAAGFGNRGMSVHKLRHTAATLLYREGGVDVRVLKEILGHEQLSTTQIYTHVSDEQIRHAAQQNPLSAQRGNKIGANLKKSKRSQPLSLNTGSSENENDDDLLDDEDE